VARPSVCWLREEKMGRLDGKVAVVLGASSGFGKAIAERFASEGAKVVAAARRVALLEELAERIDGVALRCDITSDEEVMGLIRETVRRFGRIDVAVNTVGFDQATPLKDLTPEKLHAMTAVHFFGAVSFMRHAANAMGPGGSLILFSSVNATLVGEGLVAYSGAKAALNHATKIAAVEYGPKGIRINALAPGFMRTPMTERYFERYPDLIQALTEETPLGRLGKVEEVASAALWLASDESSFVTGQIIHVDGGASLRRLPTQQQVVDIAKRRQLHP
jgi:NAD(P)-dependent dehydrogenase (short-subunit alcohol dehydrogenase family)